MDDAPLAPPPLPQGGPLPQFNTIGPSPGPRAPGRPSEDPVRNVERDRQHAESMKFLDSLPKEARENRILIYRLRPDGRTKAESRHIGLILQSDFEAEGLKDSQLLKEYLVSNFGEGRYLCEPADNRNVIMPKIPAWPVDTPHHEESMNDDDDKTPRGRRRDPDEDGADFDPDDEGDPRTRAMSVHDLVESSQERAAAERASQENAMTTLMSTMMMQQQQQREEDRRREEARREEERRADDRRREERKAEEERRREERQADEARRREEREEERKREDRKAADRNALITAVVPVLATLLAPKPKDDTMGLLLAKLLEPKPADPIVTMLLTKTLEKDGQNSGIQTMLAGMAEVQKMTSQLSAEAMKTTMATQGEMQATLVKKALEMATTMHKVNPTAEAEPGTFDKAMGMIAQILPLLNQAPAPAAPTPLPIEQVAQVVSPQEQPMANPQPAPAVAPDPVGLPAVAKCLWALEQRKYQNDDQRQQLMAYLLQQMTPELRAAVANKDEASITQIMTPVFMADETLMQWILTPSAAPFIKQVVDELAVTLTGPVKTVEAVRDPEDG